MKGISNYRLKLGSSRGLGKAIVLAFALQGVKGLVINSHRQSLESLDFGECLDTSVTQVLFVKADVTSLSDVRCPTLH